MNLEFNDPGGTLALSRIEGFGLFSGDRNSEPATRVFMSP